MFCPFAFAIHLRCLHLRLHNWHAKQLIVLLRETVMRHLLIAIAIACLSSHSAKCCSKWSSVTLCDALYGQMANCCVAVCRCESIVSLILLSNVTQPHKPSHISPNVAAVVIAERCANYCKDSERTLSGVLSVCYCYDWTSLLRCLQFSLKWSTVTITVSFIKWNSTVKWETRNETRL